MNKINDYLFDYLLLDYLFQGKSKQL